MRVRAWRPTLPALCGQTWPDRFNKMALGKCCGDRNDSLVARRIDVLFGAASRIGAKDRTAAGRRVGVTSESAFERVPPLSRMNIRTTTSAPWPERPPPSPAASFRSKRTTKKGELTDKELQTLRPLFDQFDADRSGSVSVSELAKIVALMKLEISPSEVKALVAEADVDGSGEISFEEVRQPAPLARARQINDPPTLSPCPRALSSRHPAHAL